jgi:hypothetical protein
MKVSAKEVRIFNVLKKIDSHSFSILKVKVEKPQMPRISELRNLEAFLFDNNRLTVTKVDLYSPLADIRNPTPG